MIKNRIEKDEAEHRTQLERRHESVSSKNMKILGLNREKIQKIIKSLSSSRAAQSTFIELMTDTAGRIGGTRLKCLKCDEEITLEHMLIKCPEIQEERINASVYDGNDGRWDYKTIRKDHKKLSYFMMESHHKIKKIINATRIAYYKKKKRNAV